MLNWYSRHRRDLPWRNAAPQNSGRPDPYHVLVSEAMLQQTQVVTVIPYFHRFLQAFPTLGSLAAADERQVLRLWQGLGYYSRARNLRKAAIELLNRFSGSIPASVEELMSLPGVGRYTAGAVASIAFDRRAPIVDGNVARVLSRLDGVLDDPRTPAAVQRLWSRAEELLPRTRCGNFNSALMELGATVCTPRNPQCLLCPVRQHCVALSRGLVERIPPPRTRKPSPINRRVVVCLVRQSSDGAKVLLEQRPAQGRWASMWQLVTFRAGDNPAETWQRIEADLGPLPNRRRVAQVKHTLTHRRYEFDVWIAPAGKTGRASPPRRWVGIDALSDYPLPRPHVLVAGLLREQSAQLPPVAKGPQVAPAAHVS